MKREGDKVLFDNPTQHRQFENALGEAHGVNHMVSQFAAAVGRARMEAAGWWTLIEKKVPLAKGETFAYDCPSRMRRSRLWRAAPFSR